MSDRAAREEAIKLNKSFIIQAPAGSGKTELLIQRFLAALADSNQHPEEVLAITFTKKAAIEMQARIISALLKARDSIPPEDEHSRKTYNLAKACLEKNNKLNWNLLENQHRICVMTIDSLCYKINKETNAFIPEPHPTPTLFYQHVVNDFINDLLTENDQDFAECLLYFANQISWINQLFCESLATRDQWLPLIFSYPDPSAANMKYIQAIWRPIFEKYKIIKSSPEIMIIDECLKNIGFAPKLTEEIHDFDSEATALKKIANILLTSDGKIRSSYTKKQGFFASKDLCKAEQTLQNNNKAVLKNFAESEENYWRTIHAAPLIEDSELLIILPKLLQLLQKLVTYLKFHFSDAETTDFIEQTQNTILSLQNNIEWSLTPGVPRPGTIRHILLDEFQDTAKPQMLLLEALLMHFDENQKNSIFIVGDPMQSIYRFRQADVSLFYKVQQQGIGGIKLYFLQLRSNFRSNADLITYFNNLFPNIFPRQTIPKIGAVPYHCSEASNSSNSIVSFQTFYDIHSQMQSIAEICNKHKGSNIGILVRSRAIAEQLLPYLKDFAVNEHGLKPSIKAAETDDLLRITEFLIEPHSSMSCAALLRSRLVGCSMQELYILCEYGTGNTLLESLSNNNINRQVADIQAKFKDLTQELIAAVTCNQGLTLSEKTLKLWRAISPLAASDLVTTQISWEYFSFLTQAEKIAPFSTMPTLYEMLQGSVSIRNNAQINLMTIHKSKGLEFDIVILPCLEKTIANRSGKLLWWEQTKENFLWLPNHPNQNALSSVHKHVYDLESAREHQEKIRLLYVAMTRAKEHLYGFAEIAEKPKANSFADLIWQWAEFKPINKKTANQLHARLEFLRNNYFNPKIDNVVYTKLPETSNQIYGIAWHYWLYLFLSKQTDLIEKLRLYLYELNFNEKDINITINRLASEWQESQSFSFIKWLAQQTEVWPEYELVLDGKKIIIDLIVKNADTYLIIDFKTNSMPNSNNLAAWYKQTNNYKSAISRHLSIALNSINLIIYNPIYDLKYKIQGGKYVRDNSYSSFK